MGDHEVAWRGAVYTAVEAKEDEQACSPLPLLDPQVARELGFEGVVAKNHSSLYRSNDRGWVKVKNPNYWRRDAEREAMNRSASVGRELASD